MRLDHDNNPHAIENLRDYINRELKIVDNPRYVYAVINKISPSDMFFITTYPQEWVDIYLSEKFHHIDPVIISAYQRCSPFFWDENLTLPTENKVAKIFTLSRKYNVISGITFVLHDHFNNLATLSLLIDQQSKAEMEDRLKKNRNALQMLLIDINEQMHLFALDRPDNRILLAGNNLLSPREKEVLYWASMGKTYHEIASTAGISPRTVKFHMANVVKKLGAKNARQAIRFCVEFERPSSSEA